MFIPWFFSLDEVKLIHQNQIELYGGLSGIRGESTILSALEAPR